MKDSSLASSKILVAIAYVIFKMKSVPSGHIYAMIMDKMSLQDYQTIIGALVNTFRVVKRENHLLTWVGPDNFTGQPGEPEPQDINEFLKLGPVATGETIH